MAARSSSRCLRLANAHTTSAAASFLQIAPRRCFQSSSAPLLDFLAPQAQLSMWSPHSTRSYNQPRELHQSRKQRCFSTTGRRKATKAIVNATKDDDGNEMLLDITPRAAKVHTRSPFSFAPLGVRISLMSVHSDSVIS